MAPHRTSSLAARPRSIALGWLATYLGVSGIVLVVSGHGWLATLHAALILVAWRSGSSTSPIGLGVGDLLPLITAALLYGEIPYLIAALGTTYHDVRVQAWEAAVFGTQPSHTLASLVSVRAISELLHAGYLAYYPAIFVPPVLLLLRGERRGLGQTVLALTATYTLCWMLFALWPVEGPRYLWSAPVGVPSGPVRDATLRILAEGSSRGAAFPSSHMAIAVAQTMMAVRWQRRAAWVLAGVAGLIGVGAVYGGFHYAIDIIVGAALGATVSGAVLSCFRKRQEPETAN